MTNIYHITHIRNLPNIIRDGCLWCDSESTTRRINPVEIAYTNIKERRSHTVVPLSQQGMLSEYVPFYFCNRSPMLYVISRGYVPAYRDGQERIIYLVSSAEYVEQHNLPFAFTDGHAIVAISRFYDSLQDLDQVDWKVIRDWSWHDRLEDNDRERRKQAEFLVHNHFPWDGVQAIGVINQKMAQQVRALIDTAYHKPVVQIQRKWYY